MATPANTLDDLRVLDSEILWRLIHPRYYVENPNMLGSWVIQAGAFAHNHRNCSVLRSGLVSIDFVKANFPNYGIAALKAEDVRMKAQCVLAIETDPNFSWPTDAHACLYKAPNKKSLKPVNWNALVLLAEQNLILKPII